MFSQLLSSGQRQGQEVGLHIFPVISGGFIFSWRNPIFYVDSFPFICIFFFQLCIRIVSPLYNLINVMKHEGEIVGVTCVVSEDMVCL